MAGIALVAIVAGVLTPIWASGPLAASPDQDDIRLRIGQARGMSLFRLSSYANHVGST